MIAILRHARASAEAPVENAPFMSPSVCPDMSRRTGAEDGARETDSKNKEGGERRWRRQWE